MPRAAALALTLALAATPSGADVGRVLDEVIGPGHAAFAAAAEDLAAAAAADCRAASVRPAYEAAWDAWLGVAALRFGPGEAAAPSIAFWPDPNGATPRAVDALLAQGADGPDDLADASVAGRGLLALDRLLGEPALAGDVSGGPACGLVRALAADLALQAGALQGEWDGFAVLMRTAGEPGNDRFLAPREAENLLYTHLVAGLEFDRDQRLGRPLGTFDRPRPTRAEAWRTDRSAPNLVRSLEASRALARALAPGPIPATEAAFASALDAAGRLSDPGLQDLGDPQAWLRADVARQRIDAILGPVAAEIGAPGGLAAGFNSQDGD